MRKNRFYKTVLFTICSILLQYGYAQDGFRYSAQLNPVATAGFYKIILQPSLTAQLQANMTDIRILDAAGRQVPYILQLDTPDSTYQKFVDLPIISNKKEADKQLHVVIQDSLDIVRSELSLVIKNTDANRTVTLSGSNDNQHWFAIKENIRLENSHYSTGDTFIQTLSFPKSRYRYYDITIIGKNILAVNIVKAGFYELKSAPVTYLPVPVTALLQKDSVDKYSYVFIRFNGTHFIDRFEMDVKADRYLRREMTAYSGAIGKEVSEGDFVLVSSLNEMPYDITTKTDHLLFKIQNNDNPPLKIDAIRAFQLTRSLIAYLDKGNEYRLVWGDSSATKPSYELEAFKDSIGSNIASLGYGSTQKNITPIKKAEAASNNRTWIWLAIAAVCIVLLILTFSLTKEMKKRNNDRL